MFLYVYTQFTFVFDDDTTVSGEHWLRDFPGNHVSAWIKRDWLVWSWAFCKLGLAPSLRKGKKWHVTWYQEQVFVYFARRQLWPSCRPESLRDMKLRPNFFLGVFVLRCFKCPEITFWRSTTTKLTRPPLLTKMHRSNEPTCLDLCTWRSQKGTFLDVASFPLSPIVLIDFSRHGPSLQRMWWWTMSVSHFLARFTWWNFSGFVFFVLFW